MLTLVTGTPGSGKTLNVIKEVYERYQAEWHGRNVYYFNIVGCQVAAWHELEIEQVKTWFNLPKGSIVIVDEAQALFPTRDFRKDVPEHIHRLSTHRHDGFDIFLITQHPMLLDASARRMVGRHVHYERRFGSKRVNRFTWQRASDDPLDYHQKQEAVSDAILLDKKIYSLYKSAEIHTHKFRLPKKVILALAFFPLAALAAWWGISSLNLPDTGNNHVDSVAMFSDNLSSSPHSVSQGNRVTFNDRIPRVEGIPSTAPRYDHLTTPVSFPRLQCVHRKASAVASFRHVPKNYERCQCYSQQGTQLDTPFELCAEIVARGYFDDTLPDRDNVNKRDQQHSGVNSTM